MVFSNDRMKSQHHNRLNLRDTSQEPSNIYGDANLPASRHTNAATNAYAAASAAARAADNDDDFNDRLPDDLPPLEEAHVPHA